MSNTIKITIRELRRWREQPVTPTDQALKLAQFEGITLTHALLALAEGECSQKQRLVLDQLVQCARGTLLSCHHADVGPSHLSRRWRLLAQITHIEPYDYARGYRPEMRTSYYARNVRGDSDSDTIDTLWADHKPHKDGLYIPKH